MSDSADDASLLSRFGSWVKGLLRTPPPAKPEPKGSSTCSKCSQVYSERERSPIDASMCRSCGSQCLRCYSYPYDSQLRLCRQHWEEHCQLHPEAKTTCPECSQTVPTTSIREGVCWQCLARRDWKLCPKCNKLRPMKSKNSCWDCWDGG